MQDGCQKLSAECGGHGRQSCSACTQHSVAGSIARNPASHKSLCGAASVYNKYHSKSRNRIPLCASRHHARQLVLNGSNTTVPAALGKAGSPRPALCQCWLPPAQVGEPGPPTGWGRLGLHLHTAAIWLWALHPHILCSFCAVWLQVVPPCKTAPQPL